MQNPRLVVCTKLSLGRCRIGRVICRRGMDNSTKGISNEARNARVKTTSWGNVETITIKVLLVLLCPLRRVPVKLFQLFQCEVGRIFLLDFLFEAKIMSLYEFLHGHVMSFCSSKCTKDRSIVLKTLGFFGSRSAPHIARRALEVLWFLEAPPTSMRWTHLHGYGRSSALSFVTVVFANCPEEAIKVPKLSWMSKAGSSKLECWITSRLQAIIFNTKTCT